jgi:quercetin dioxygenase-like cupin family protein
MKAKYSGMRVVAAAAVGVLLFALAAYSAVSQIIAVGTMEHSALVGGPATLTMRTLTIDPAEVLGWHYHPGAGAFTIVKEGTLVVEDGCGGETTYPAGTAFLEPPFRVHRGKNLTDQPVITAQMFVVPTGVGTSVSTEQRCGPPATVADCQDAGWTTFDHPRVFFSQGECAQYVNTGR